MGSVERKQPQFPVMREASYSWCADLKGKHVMCYKFTCVYKQKDLISSWGVMHTFLFLSLYYFSQVTKIGQCFWQLWQLIFLESSKIHRPWQSVDDFTNLHISRTHWAEDRQVEKWQIYSRFWICCFQKTSISQRCYAWKLKQVEMRKMKAFSKPSNTIKRHNRLDEYDSCCNMLLFMWRGTELRNNNVNRTKKKNNMARNNLAC